MDENENTKIQAVARRCDSIRRGILFLTNIAVGTAIFDEQSSVLSVSNEEGKVLGSKAVACPVIGSEFEFEEFLVTVECARSALDDVTNHMDQPPIVAVNPSKIHKHAQQHSSHQDVVLASDRNPESDFNTKFAVAYTRWLTNNIF